MRVGVDLRFTAASHMGTGVYAETATLGLAAALEEGDRLLGFSEDEHIGESLAAHVEHVRVPNAYKGANADLARRLLWDSAIASAELDVFFAPTGLAPVVRACPVVTTIHDLLFEHEPSHFSPGLLACLKREIPRSVRRADAVIAVSEFTRQDIVSSYGVPSERVHVIRQGLRDIFRKRPSKAAVHEAAKVLGVKRPYLLAFSNHAPHKNTAFAVEVFARWAERRRDRKHRLVIAGGGPAPQAAVDLQHAAERHGLRDRVAVLGRVVDAHLPGLLAGAELLMFPSLFEGWGLPPLEAIAVGTPALVSDRGALPEAVGDAGLILPLTDAAPWVEAVGGLLSKGISARLQRAMRTRRASLFDPGGERLRTVLAQAARQGAPRPGDTVSVPSPRPRERIVVVYRADWESPSGFASAARAHAWALQGEGALVCRDAAPRDRVRLEGLDLPGKPLSQRASREMPRIVIHHCSPDDIRLAEGKYNIGFFVWETDRIPAGDARDARYDWVRILNELDEIWTASRFTREVLDKCGVDCACSVFGHPVNTSFYSPGARRLLTSRVPDAFDPTWTVLLYVGSWDTRKRPDELVRAYLKAFGPSDRTLLILKTYPTGTHDSPSRLASACTQIREEMGIPEPEAPAVTICTDVWLANRMRDLYRSAHAFVTATRGEGFGLCAVEAMACGVPVIATAFSAMGDYLTEDVGYPVPHRLETVPRDSIFPWFRKNQRWGVPETNALATAMRRVHENRAEAQEKGRHARALVESRYSPHVVGLRMRERLEAIADKRSPGRKGSA